MCVLQMRTGTNNLRCIVHPYNDTVSHTRYDKQSHYLNYYTKKLYTIIIWISCY